MTHSSNNESSQIVILETLGSNERIYIIFTKFNIIWNITVTETDYYLDQHFSTNFVYKNDNRLHATHTFITPRFFTLAVWEKSSIIKN